MYKNIMNIMVPLDNSEYSNCAADLAIAIGERFGASLRGDGRGEETLRDVRWLPPIRSNLDLV